MKILDATAGSRSIWYEKNHPYTVYLDKRIGVFSSQSGNKKRKDVRSYKVFPNVVGRWENLPFKNDCFDTVVFDPPHLIKQRDKKLMGMVACYGVLYTDNWKQVLSNGIDELFRVLKPNGAFIFKWCENDRSIEDVLCLFPYKPVFGTRTGQRNDNHWIYFLKHR